MKNSASGRGLGKEPTGEWPASQTPVTGSQLTGLAGMGTLRESSTLFIAKRWRFGTRKMDFFGFFKENAKSEG
jgi:hypothetical protein